MLESIYAFWWFLIVVFGLFALFALFVFVLLMSKSSDENEEATDKRQDSRHDRPIQRS